MTAATTSSTATQASVKAPVLASGTLAWSSLVTALAPDRVNVRLGPLRGRRSTFLEVREVPLVVIGRRAGLVCIMAQAPQRFETFDATRHRRLAESNPGACTI